MADVSVTHASFRGDFPVFADAARYPEPSISFWLGLARKLLRADRWDDLIDIGAELFVAHNLVLERRAQDLADNGGVPGLTTGPINSQSVDKASVGYDTGAGIELDAGHWNNTIYGTRFIHLARLVGAGPVQVGVSQCGTDPLSSQNAWCGPPLGYPWST